MVDLGLKTLLHDRLRFAITVSGVAFAVTLVFTQMGLFFGLLENATITIDKIDADLWVTSKNTPNVDFARAFPESHVNRVRSVEGVARADNLNVAFVNIALPTGATELLLVYALEDFRRWGLPWEIVEGDVDELRRGNYAFLDDSAAARFGHFDVGDYREIIGRRVKIIGRTRQAKSFTTSPIVFVDFRLAQELSPEQLGNSTTYVLVKLEPGADVERVRASIQQRLPFNDVHTKSEWSQRSRRYWIESTGIGFNMMITVFLGCLVGVVVVAQTLYTSTMEHLREFGTVKAIGGSNGDIYRILARQATIAALVGFAIGLLLSLALRPAISMLGLKLVMPLELVAIVLAGTLALCLLAAMVSFRKVATIDPALVFRG
jgi:putative ABC transport system permease protein